MNYQRAIRVGALVLSVVGVISCGIDEFSSTNVPDGAHLSLTFACPKDSTQTATECAVNGLVTLSTQESAGRGWIVDMLVNHGTFVTASKDSVVHTLRLVTGEGGEVLARFRAPTTPASVIFTLAGHGIVAVETLTVVDRDATDDPPATAIAVTPNPITVKRGDSIQVAVTFADANKKALPGRRGYFSTDNTNASISAGPTEKAWLKGSDTGAAVLRVTRRALLAQVPVTITP